MSDVFISYSRKDKDFVRKLHDALVAQKREVWVDWEDIPPTADWHAEIFAAIESAQAFLFVLSPDSIDSKVCGEELAHAIETHKRLVPLVCRDVDFQRVNPVLAQLNSIFFRTTDDFDDAVARLLKALDTDLDWVKTHTRLLTRAVEWDSKKRNDALLLRGGELRAAEEWQAQAAAGKEPKPTALQGEYILASRKSATRQQRTILTGVTLALVVAISLACLASVLGLFAWDQSNVATSQKNTAVAERNVRATAEAQAVTERNIAQSRELAVTSSAQTGANPELSLLLALEAVRLAPTAESESALRAALLLPERKTIRTGTAPVGTVEFSPDGKYLLTTIHDSPAKLWEVSTGKLVGQLGTDATDVAMFSPDGKLIAVQQEHSVILDDATNAKPVAQLEDPARVPFVKEFSADSRLVLTSGGVFSQSGGVTDSVVAVWDTRTGKQLVALEGERNGAFSPDDKSVVTIGTDTSARLWDISAASNASSGKLVAELKGHTAAVSFAQFSPDGKMIVTGSDDKTARLWDARTGKLVAELRGHTGAVSLIRFSPDSQLIATAAGKPSDNATVADNTVRLWDARTGKAIAVLQGHTGAVRSVEFNADSTRILTVGEDWNAIIWDTAGEGRAGLSGYISDAWFSPDGHSVLSQGRCASFQCDTVARLWTVSGQGTLPVLELRGHSSWINQATFSRDGRLVATAGDDGTARIWDISAGSSLREFNVSNPQEYTSLSQARFSPDGRLIVAAYSDNRARVWDAQTGKSVIELIGHTGQVYDAAFSPDGGRIITASADKTARIWEVATRKPLLPPLANPSEVYSAWYSPDGKWIVTTCADNTARVWEASTGKQVTELHGATTASFSPDSRWLVTTGDNNTPTQIWETETGKLVSSFGKSGVAGAIFSPNGKWIATKSGLIAQLWESETGKLVLELIGHTTPIEAMAFSPDSQRLLTAGDDGVTQVWDLSTGKIASILTGHRRRVNQAAFSSDGKFIVTASDDLTARVWDANTGANLLILYGQPERVYSARFSPDNKYILTGTYSGARLYACEVCGSLDEMLALAHTRVNRQLTCEERQTYLNDNSTCSPTTPTPSP